MELRDDTASVIGVIDVVRDFRREREWYLGLLLLDAPRRSAGLGREVLAELAAAVVTAGADSLRLAVAEQNEAALRFWTREGFRIAFRTPPRRTGERETVLIEMVKPLGPAAAAGR